MKECNILREQLLSQKNLGNKYEYLEIRYFTSTEGLDPDVLGKILILFILIDIVNGRLEEVKNLYNTKLNDLNQINEDLKIKIEIINEMNDPEKFTFSEMNALGFI